MQLLELTTGSWLENRILVADIHGGKVTVVKGEFDGDGDTVCVGRLYS